MRINFIIPVIISILLGTLCGQIVFDQYQKKEEVFNEQNSVYMLQQGVYSTKEAMEENTEKLTSKVSVIENGKYYVYVGITKEKENAEKIQKLYDQKGYSIYLKEGSISNYEFINNLEQYDILLKSATKEEDIQSVTNTILASYEESFLN